MIDNQWPNAKPFPPYFQTEDWDECNQRYDDVENALTERFGVSAVLLPSARAGIASILEYCGTSRKQQVFSPKYSSHCVWDVIGRVTNPTVTLNTGADVILAVHKWGYTYSLNKRSQAVVIEDSVDNLVTSGGLFPSGGEFEVLSLPKTIASYCGGVVLTKNNDYVSQLKQSRLDNKALISYQSELKSRKYMGNLPSFICPEMNEAINRGLDLHGLENIADNLSNYDTNLTTVRKRAEKVNAHFDKELVSSSGARMPCLFPARVIQFTVTKPELFMQRQFNWSLTLDIDAFEPCWLLPMHFGISDEMFESMLTSMTMQARV
jgi:putative PLP-dependent aminotransferase (TIGR04422 family)